ncbi:molybdenum ABC transporter ATP-binding protein [Roseobacter litoralis]|uniref:Molybdenum import ATP-binding protein ModC n=1 Tax=Roseobacter litoralis (strain ATCC 49566 / DSM 6996 / JCM 21268 / NBRC 15278 / OCh 149) TaxID=391595 RepID=F7ZFX7_ROSLO|nr:molybdenum ABC transporter ATP-binding protein [Roseobacter litoralis]AEI93517.1 molybdenum import ATP-binding protein ModC [Roseobacter litoralis Och 149]
MSLAVSLKHAFAGFTLDASFEAPNGITVLYGRSGSGKTTIVNALAGLLHPNQGHISIGAQTLFDSQTGQHLPASKRRIGYIFQEGRLFPHLSVRQNLKYGQWFAPKSAPKSDFDQIVEMLGIAALLDRRPVRLSGGEKQRVAIGRALLSSPQMILADEPLAALDDARKEEIMPYFERLRDALGIPILYVSHAGTEVARLATTIVVLQDGRVVRQGPAGEVLSDPDVTPLGATAAGVMVQARVTAQHSDGLTEVLTGGLPLLVPAAAYPVGSTLRLRIEAQDVMLATEKPNAISALNILPATVATLRLGDGPGALVQIKAGENLLLARITRRSVEALNLKVGTPVYAVLKAVSIPRGAIGDQHPTL